mgnify:CR=1 FL=1
MAELNDPVIGGKLDSTVIAQLAVRKNILKKTSGRTSDELLYLNSNTGWVRLTSSVDVETPTPQGATKEYSNVLAKGNILFAGTSSSTSMRGGYGGTNSSYTLSNTLGERPMPGITDVIISSQNTFGTLRIGTVKFTVNSIEQLDSMEALFMRPGFSALLEWGHTLYYENDNTKLQKNPEVIDGFLTGTSRAEIDKKIVQKKIDTSNNYDGMYGIIKNFVWSMNTTGGYDCSVDIISVGEILESIKIDISPSTMFTTDPFKPAQEQAGTENTPEDTAKAETFSADLKATALHAYLNIIKYAGTSKFYKEEREISLEQANEKLIAAHNHLKRYIPSFYTKILKTLLQSGVKFEVPAIKLEGEVAETFGSWSSYISIGHLLAVINESFLLKDGNGLIFKFFTGNKDTVKTPFLTFDGHIALDPQIAVLPKPKQDINYIVGEGGLEKQVNKTSWDDVLRYNITNLTNNSLIHGQFDDILGIYLNIDYILKCLDATIDTENPSNKSLRDFINKLLRGLQTTIGDVNDFDLHFEEDTSTYYIVDRKLTPDEDKLKGSKFELIGLNSTVENLSLTSKLTSSITTMMAVSAQATSSDIGEDTLALQKWQEGLMDRHSKSKQISQETADEASCLTEGELKVQIENQEKARKKIIAAEQDWANVKTVVNKLNTDFNTGTLNYNNSELQGAKSSFKNLMVKLLEFNTKRKKASPAGLIPLELNLTIHGLGGVKIGQAFTVSEELLPSRYRGNVGFLITGIDHKINSNRWNTVIKAQMILISKYKEDNIEITIEEINRAFEIITTPTPNLEELVDWKKPLAVINYRTGGAGLAHYGAPRLNERGETRLHEGIDFATRFGEAVYSPIDGVIQFTRAFSKAGTESVRIQGTGKYEGYGVQLGYVAANRGYNSGKTVKAGEQVGTAQNMTQYYPNAPTMQNHMHFILYVGNDPKNRIDPTDLKFV